MMKMKGPLTNPLDENNNKDDANKIVLSIFDSEPGYYSVVIRPMLMPGHETELLYWCRSMGLILAEHICDNGTEDPACDKSMEWTPAKIKDYYQWRCRNCQRKKSIRQGSIFEGVKCNFKEAIRIILGWCKGYDIFALSEILGVKKHVISHLYESVTAAAGRFLHSSLCSDKIGGLGVVVLIDTYPEGEPMDSPNQHDNKRVIFRIAEAKNIPPTYWFYALDEPYHHHRMLAKSKDEARKQRALTIRKNLLSIVREIVAPGSILVSPAESMFCSYSDLKSISGQYPALVSVDGLKRHNNVNSTVDNNVRTIWQLANGVCEEAQSYSGQQINRFLTNQLWSRRFHNESLQMLLHQLTADMQ